LIDHINRGTINLSNVKTLVLDEADEMLNMGFLEDIESILKAVPDQRQTLLFSATMPPAIKRIGVQFMTEPEHIQIAAKELTTDLVEQYYVRVRDFEKFDTLTHILDVQQPKLAIMFGRTKRRVDELTRGLELRGFNAAGIHGDLTQQKRSQVLKQFKNGEIKILVATDVAARGLDVSGVDYVYNFDIPQDSESYVHRIGRTGRAGKSGVAVTFVTPREMSYLRIVEETTKKRMTPLKPPTADEALVGQQEVAVQQLKEIVEKNHLSTYRAMAEELLKDTDAIDLVAAALKSLTKEPDDTPIKISEERPLPMRRGGGRGNGGGRGGNRNFRGGNRNRSNGGDRRRREGGERGGDRRGNGGGDRRRREGGDRRPRRHNNEG